MYENMTYERILQRMLNRMPNTIDKQEGSVIYDALAPAAVELQNMYIELDAILHETFADTASRENLIRRAAERGIKPKAASAAVMKGEFNIDIPTGSRFSFESFNYTAVEKIDTGIYKLICETAGKEGGSSLGTLIPIEYIQGLEAARLTEVLIPGEDEENTETFRQRYFDSLDSQAFGGNIKDYTDKTLSISGVGAVKVTPVWNGGGTVKLTVLDSDFNKASTELITTVQEEIDPTQDGSGWGLRRLGIW